MSGKLALVLTGGGARAAYQAGVIHRITEALPDLEVPVLTGVSAGAINAAFLANRPSTLSQAGSELSRLWSELELERVLNVAGWSMVQNVVRWGLRLTSGGVGDDAELRGLLDTSPLRELMSHQLANDDGRLRHVENNVKSGALSALAVTTTNYTTGQAVTFIDGHAGTGWKRPFRRSRETTMTVDHVLASAAIPLLFPATRLGRAWHGDGGVRQTAPLSPAIHLGADKILAISTLGTPSPERSEDGGERYPPPAQILGVLVNSIFLDNIDYDAANLERINQLCKDGCAEYGLRRVRLLVLRPSADLGSLAGEFEPRLPRSVRYMTRGWGTQRTKSTDVLATLMFESGYTQRLIELGRSDTEARMKDIATFLADG